MCLCVYSEEGTIQIPFISESISLNRKGSSKTVIDILIENTNPYPISSFCVLYPNNFLNIDNLLRKKKKQQKRNKKSKGHRETPFAYTGFFQDQSSDLAKDKEKINRTYTISAYKREFPSVNVLNLNKPNPEDVKNPIPYKGYIPAEDEKDNFSLHKKITDNGWYILNAIYMSIFNYSFDQPLESNNKRWVRLFFKPDMVATYHQTWGKRILSWSINELEFTYCIMGPVDVKNIFVERLSIRETVLNEEKGKSEITPDEKATIDKKLRAINNIRVNVENPMNKYAPTVYKDFTLHIFSGKLRILRSLFCTGNITPNGVLPNYLPEDRVANIFTSWERRVYDFSATNINTADKKDGFNIFFSAKAQNRYLKTIIFLTIFVIICRAILPDISGYLEKLFVFLNAKKIYEYLKIFHDIFLIQYPILAVLAGLVLPPIFSYFYKLWKKHGWRIKKKSTSFFD